MSYLLHLAERTVVYPLFMLRISLELSNVLDKHLHQLDMCYRHDWKTKNDNILSKLNIVESLVSNAGL